MMGRLMVLALAGMAAGVFIVTVACIAWAVANAAGAGLGVRLGVAFGAAYVAVGVLSMLFRAWGLMP